MEGRDRRPGGTRRGCAIRRNALWENVWLTEPANTPDYFNKKKTENGIKLENLKSFMIF